MRLGLAAWGGEARVLQSRLKGLEFAIFGIRRRTENAETIIERARSPSHLSELTPGVAVRIL